MPPRKLGRKEFFVAETWGKEWSKSDNEEFMKGDGVFTEGYESFD